MSPRRPAGVTVAGMVGHAGDARVAGFLLILAVPRLIAPRPVVSITRHAHPLVRAAFAARNPRQNPHLRYCDSASNGVATAVVYADRVEAELVTVEEPVVDRGAAGARVLRRASWSRRDARAKGRA